MTITTEMHGNVAVISLDDGKVNACSADMLTRFNQALDQAEAHAGAVVVVGRPGCFSGGFDLKVMREGTDEQRMEMIGLGMSTALRLFTFPLPTVAAVTGHALALGAIWLLCFDTRIGEPGEYRLAMNETALGMTLPPFAIEPAKLALAPKHFVPAVVQARIYDPQTAVEAGYLDQLAGPGEAKAAAIAFAGQMAQYPKEAYYSNKLAARGEAVAKIRASMGLE